MTSNQDQNTPPDLDEFNPPDLDEFNPSGSTALIALGLIWGAGFFSLGYMAGVWGWL